MRETFTDRASGKKITVIWPARAKSDWAVKETKRIINRQHDQKYGEHDAMHDAALESEQKESKSNARLREYRKDIRLSKAEKFENDDKIKYQLNRRNFAKGKLFAREAGMADAIGGDDIISTEEVAMRTDYLMNKIADGDKIDIMLEHEIIEMWKRLSKETQSRPSRLDTLGK